VPITRAQVMATATVLRRLCRRARRRAIRLIPRSPSVLPDRIADRHHPANSALAAIGRIGPGPAEADTNPMCSARGTAG